jgi:GTP-binding protein
MFIDEAHIHVKAGDGGNGCVSFRREKFIHKGGPDGGDGGNGGTVRFVADPSKNTLMDFAGKHHWKAPRGIDGMGKKMAGHNGEDLIIPVPPGTLIFDEDNEMILLADLNEPGREITIAKGGRGGLGNWNFRSATNQTPRYAEAGTLGQERNLKLELKLIADVGLVGMPNAGKSTLLSVVSAARPKIASYPFTTLEPQLGIAVLSGDRRIVFADIPGLIEGAHQGAGLGIDFLKHIERTKVIVHLLDLYPSDESDPFDNYQKIRAELEAFSPLLATKEEIIAANKIDLSTDDSALEALRQKLKKKEIFPISGAAKLGVDDLLQALWKKLQQVKEDEAAKKPSESLPSA